MSHIQLLVEKKCDTLRQGLIVLGELVGAALGRSLDALRRQDLALAAQVIEADLSINQARRLLEHEAMLALAAYQPAGTDLRVIASTLHLVGELERIADHAADVGRILLREPERVYPQGLVEAVAAIGDGASRMFSAAMDGFANPSGDAAQARAVAAMDDEVDALQGEVIVAIVDLVRDDSSTAEAAIALSFIAHHYERVADRATNIAERVVYIATGDTPDLN